MRNGAGGNNIYYGGEKMRIGLGWQGDMGTVFSYLEGCDVEEGNTWTETRIIGQKLQGDLSAPYTRKFS